MFRYVRTTLCAVLLVGAPITSAQEYLLSVSWEPAFCQTHTNKTECSNPSPDGFAAQNLVAHGLWPQPESNSYCGVSNTQKVLDKQGKWDRLPATQLSQQTRDRLATIMPGIASNLDRHEWIKHGTCSGMSAEQYFSTLIKLVEQFDQSNTNKLVAAHSGQTIQQQDITTTLAQDFGNTADAATAILCDNGQLSEIRLNLDSSVLQDGLKPAAFRPTQAGSTCNNSISIAAPN